MLRSCLSAADVRVFYVTASLCLHDVMGITHGFIPAGQGSRLAGPKIVW